MVKQFWWYVYLFWHNSRMWQSDRHTHRQTDTAWQHRPRLCIASKNSIKSTHKTNRKHKQTKLMHDCSSKSNMYKDSRLCWGMNAVTLSHSTAWLCTFHVCEWQAAFPPDETGTALGASADADAFLKAPLWPASRHPRNLLQDYLHVSVAYNIGTRNTKQHTIKFIDHQKCNNKQELTKNGSYFDVYLPVELTSLRYPVVDRNT